MRLGQAADSKVSGVLIPLAVSVLFAACLALAQGSQKSYSEQGKVTGTGTVGHTHGHGTAYSHTYKVETNTAILVLDCGKLPFIGGGTGTECGGNKKIQMGDVIQFRIEKEFAYIPLTEANKDSMREERLRILSRELKPDSVTDKVEATQP